MTVSDKLVLILDKIYTNPSGMVLLEAIINKAWAGQILDLLVLPNGFISSKY